MPDILNTLHPDAGHLSTFESALVRSGDYTIGEAMLAQSVARMRICAGDTAERILSETYPELMDGSSASDVARMVADLTEPD
jgi:hypothetical protein